MSVELGTCPFCGGKAAFVPRAVNIALQKDPSDPKFGVSVICGGCGSESPNMVDEAHAASAWNRRATHGVAPTAPTPRPATVAEAQHAAEIGACLPNGVLFDAFGNPRTRYTRVIADGSTCVCDDVQVREWREDEARTPGTYVFQDVYLSKEEFDGLPEFDGF